MPRRDGDASGTVEREFPIRQSSRWFQLMLLACLTNGLGAFGLKILAERGLTDRFESQYLLFWYLGWLLFSAAVLLVKPFKPYLREIVIAFAMGLCSLAGQFFTGLALARDVAGHVAFSISTGGTLFIVALAGIFLFREKVGPYGIAGLVLGIASIVVLSLT
jgi:drug/metabolite transporter (DMT)-like permease